MSVTSETLISMARSQQCKEITECHTMEMNSRVEKIKIGSWQKEHQVKQLWKTVNLKNLICNNCPKNIFQEFILQPYIAPAVTSWLLQSHLGSCCHKLAIATTYRLMPTLPSARKLKYYTTLFQTGIRLRGVIFKKGPFSSWPVTLRHIPFISLQIRVHTSDCEQRSPWWDGQDMTGWSQKGPVCPWTRISV